MTSPAATDPSDVRPEHHPYVPDEAIIPEFTWSAVLVGAVLGILFGASSLYLVLKVGMTISASIPVAVLSITLFRLMQRWFGIRRATILENNIVQTTGSAGESIAFGVGVTMPALLLMGFEMEITRVLVVSVLGGALGILMMIPLRRAFIVKQHEQLRYPEGTACADVLIVGEQGGATAMTVFGGFGIAFLYQCLCRGLRLWKDVPAQALDWFKGAVPALEADPALLGVGYIIGTRIAAIMTAGGVLAYLVFVPAIHFFGDALAGPLYPGTTLIRDMDEDAVRNAYILYIGAGAVATGGILSLFQAMPLIFGSIVSGLRDLRAGGGPVSTRRTDRDMPMSVVAIGSLVLVLAIWVTLPLDQLFGWVNLVAAILIVLFGFLFVTVSSRLTGEIGSSSNPISGMTVATLLLTCLIFLMLGWTDSAHRLIALSVAAIVCIASSNGGTTSQDLKTGYLVGATPRHQQVAIIVGSITSALVIGWILVLLNQAGTVYSTKDLPKPAVPIDVTELAKTDQAPGDPTSYHVWHAGKENPQKAPQGKYLVDDQGRVRYLVDPGINGRISRDNEGNEVQKYTAPKARLMELITDGILNRRLPWTLVLLGVGIALVLELCGVPSLPFAVGVYIPLSSSTPIFVGGLVRWLVERFTKKSQAKPQSESESEMSPGVLLSTGFIAGGAIAGVLIALVSLGEMPKYLGRWQYRHYSLAQAAPTDTAYRRAAESELGLTRTSTGEQAPEEKKQIDELAGEIAALNVEQLPALVSVAKGTTLKLPGDKTYTASTDTTLGQVAQELWNNRDRSGMLFDFNSETLKPPATLPAGFELKLPQHNAPALAAFGALALLLLVVGVRRPKGVITEA